MIGYKSKLLLANLGALATVLGCSKSVPKISFDKTGAADSEAESDAPDDEEDTGDSESDSGDEEVTDGDTETGDEEEQDPEDSKPDSTVPEVPTKEPGTVKEPVVVKEPTPKENVMALDNFRWELPCEKEDPGDNTLCFSNVKVDQMKTIGGKAADLYEVELRFRGVTETMKYKDGMRVGDHFYVGGGPDNPTYNIYMIEVSSPKQKYYLNWTQGTDHETFLIDYTTKIKVNGGATVRLFADGQNDKMIANHRKLVSPGVDGLKDNNRGQFTQMNVVDAVLSK